MKLNIGSFCFCKENQSRRLQLLLHSHKLTYILLSCAIFGSGLLPGCQLSFTPAVQYDDYDSTSKLPEFNPFCYLAQSVRNYLGYPALLLLWQLIITPINMVPVDPKHKTESCRKKENQPGLYEPDASSFPRGLTTAPLNPLTLLPVTQGIVEAEQDSPVNCLGALGK